ncbi:hypothetical protein GCM10023162_16510 [Klenkia terrae]
MVIGRDTYVGKNVTVEVDGHIGPGCLIANNVGIVGRTDHDHNQVGTHIRHSDWVGDKPATLSTPVSIGRDVWVGFGSIILSGVTIGDHCIVAAGSVVTRDLAENSIAAGNPARVVGFRFAPDKLVLHKETLNLLENERR